MLRSHFTGRLPIVQCEPHGDIFLISDVPHEDRAREVGRGGCKRGRRRCRWWVEGDRLQVNVLVTGWIRGRDRGCDRGIDLKCHRCRTLSGRHVEPREGETIFTFCLGFSVFTAGADVRWPGFVIEYFDAF